MAEIFLEVEPLTGNPDPSGGATIHPFLKTAECETADASVGFAGHKGDAKMDQAGGHLGHGHVSSIWAYQGSRPFAHAGRGRVTERVSQWNHDKLAVFGIGADLDEPTWRSVFRQLVALGYARPDHDAFGGLRLTEASRPVLKGEQQVEMRRQVLRKGKNAKRRSPAPGSTHVLALAAP